VVVIPGKHQQVLHTAYASASEGEDGEVTLTTSSAEEVERIFGAAKRALPRRGTTFTVYFPMGSDALTEEAREVLANLLARLSTLHSGDIVVAGHTDRVGRDGVNRNLSTRRANQVRDFLVQHSIAPRSVHASGHGWREPVVQTPDGVAEPRNRRVEIELR
jgi:outer membrane protein OmpA-like peptidoglycan-associated protein